MNTIRLMVDLDYLDADKEWFQLLVQHGAWLKDMFVNVFSVFDFFLLL